MLPFWCLVLLGGLLRPSQGFPSLGSIFGRSPAQPSAGLLGTGLGSDGLIGGKDGSLGTGLLGEGGLLGTGLLGKGSPSGEESGGPLDEGKESSRPGILGTGLLGEESLLGMGVLGRGGLLSSESQNSNGDLTIAGGQPGSGGLLGTGILGGEGLGTGILGGEGLGTGILGGEGLGTGILGGEGLGNGLLNNGLLGNKSLLGEKGLLGTGLLGNKGLLGNGSLLGLNDVLGGGGLLGNGVPATSTHFSWLKVLNLENVRVSWKVLHGSELVLNMYSKLVLRLPGIFSFLSGSSVETNITSHIALTQDTPGDLKLKIKDCSNMLSGFSVNLRKGFFTNMVSSLLNSSLQSLVPALLCPLVNIWVSIVNIKLQFLNRVVSFGLLGKIHSALSNLSVTSGHYVELDLQKSPFPSAFIDWLLQITGVNPGSVP